MGIKYSRLPTKLYNVRVPIVFTYSEEELDIVGLPMLEHTTGRKEYIDDQLTLVMLPLTRIIDIYSHGAPIYLVDRDAVVEIYKALEDYLHESNTVTPDLNAPMHEDNRDIDIDRFASELFGINRNSIVNSMYNRKSGFDIGIHKMAIPSIANRKTTKGRRRVSVMDSYNKENPSTTPTSQPLVDDVYLTHNTNVVDPSTVTRTPKIRKRRKLKPPKEGY